MRKNLFQSLRPLYETLRCNVWGFATNRFRADYIRLLLDVLSLAGHKSPTNPFEPLHQYTEIL